MMEEQRRQEIREIVKLVDQVAAMSHFQIAKVHGIRVALARFENSPELLEPPEDVSPTSSQQQRFADDVKARPQF
jgi:hypothetical protein